MTKRRGIIRYLFLFLIRQYKKFFSPVFGNQCRFYPTCSEYSYILFLYYPIYLAFGKSVIRIIRCNPWSAGGVDIPGGITKDQTEDAINECRND